MEQMQEQVSESSNSFDKINCFKDFNLSDTTLKAIESKGFEEPSLIQIQAIPKILGTTNDIIAQAQTGTGKTAAFGIPMFEMLNFNGRQVKAIILTPTRELAIQVSEELYSLKGRRKLKVLPVYGGSSIERQIKKLSDGVDVVVGTPGRVLDLIGRNILKLGFIEYMVLDEADEMLNMGFIEDIEQIINACNPDRRILLFSATMPNRILEIANKYMKDIIKIKVKSKELTTNLTDQFYYEVSNNDKFEALTRILDYEKDFYGIIFCRTKSDVDTLSAGLIERGYDVEGLHGDLSQYQRERVFKKFKSRAISILIATDVAARGLDINDLSHVINYAIPQDPESYVHRIGRTGRAGKTGTAITFVTRAEYQQLYHIESIAKTKIIKKNLPGIGDVIQQKKNVLLEDIEKIIGNKVSSEFDEISKTLLQDRDAVDVISATLKYFLKNSLDYENYSEIQSLVSDESGYERLFIGRGRADGFTPRILANHIMEAVNLKNHQIKDLKVLDSFSFVSLPFEEAQMFMYIMNSGNKSHRPLVSYARESKNRAEQSFGKSNLSGNYKNVNNKRFRKPKF